ncbi:MAG: Asp-tRNA(Asn)/Glu-tRNA(Gln) amidotransferase GatCAB subunit A [Deltaproteobacteria bacterium]|nr:MAG: Asp-tRNA(Asn)/Glu-tRNA(Gln) amidotransferase GatCAB subunit A [Deltaproteobacteria bacterium]
MNLYELSVSEAARLLADRKISSRELTLSCLERIEQVEKNIGAFISVNAEGAVKQAEQADNRLKAGDGGRLCGIPISIKDLFCTKGIKTTCGSRMLADFIPPYDAAVVERLYHDGMVMIGKTSMDEFAMGSTSETCAYTVPDNPWQPGYVAGGSSGGSAASVAAGECLASIGSDTGGSIRQPAAFCGMVGLKPSYGRVSRYGLIAFASSLDQAGPITRTVEDAAIIMNSIAGYDAKDSTSVKKEVIDYTAELEQGVKGLRVGVPGEYFAQGLEPEVDRAVRNSISILQEAGAEIIDISMPKTEYCVAAYYIIAPAEASSNLARYDGVHYGLRAEEADELREVYIKSRTSGFGDEVKRRILIGTFALSSGYYDAYYKKASQVRTAILNDFMAAYEKCDVLISPVTPAPAWPKGENQDDPLNMYLSDIMTISANLAGIPAISVPCGFSKTGLPVGVQLMGPHFREELILKTARHIERELGLANSLPEYDETKYNHH